MKNPNQDSEQIWQAYTTPTNPPNPQPKPPVLPKPQVLKESSMGRLHDMAIETANMLAEQQGVQLDEHLTEFAMLLFQEAYRLGYESGEGSIDQDSVPYENPRQTNRRENESEYH